MYIDYRDKLMEIFRSNFDKCNPSLPVTSGIAFYDWCIKLENQYRQSKGFSQTVLINDKAVYEYTLSQLGAAK